MEHHLQTDLWQIFPMGYIIQTHTTSRNRRVNHQLNPYGTILIPIEPHSFFNCSPSWNLQYLDAWTGWWFRPDMNISSTLEYLLWWYMNYMNINIMNIKLWTSTLYIMNIYFDWRLMFIICFDILDPSHIKRKTQVVTATPKLIPVPVFQEWGSLMSNIVQPSNSWKRPELLGNNKHRTREASCQPLIQHPNCKDLDDLKFKSAATATDWFCTSLAAPTTAARSKCCDVAGRFHEDTRSVSFGSGFVVSECITQHCCMQKSKSKKHKSLSLYLFSCLSCGNYHIVAHWLHISEKYR